MVGPWLQPPENALLKLNVFIKMILVIFFDYVIGLSKANLKRMRFWKVSFYLVMLRSGSSL